MGDLIMSGVWKYISVGIVLFTLEVVVAIYYLADTDVQKDRQQRKDTSTHIWVKYKF